MENTANQEAFISALVLGGCTPTEAAKQAGYAQPKQRAYELLRKPHIVEAIRREQDRLLTGDLTNLALSTLRRVMGDDASSANAKVAASRAILEAGGHFKKLVGAAVPSRSITELSVKELQDKLHALQEQSRTLSN